ncbi:MAG TPA: alanine--tRNA ligase [Nitrolancea sp.]|nr:alanine--tRNA ligase [Nitrolancea sp.]
MKSDDIRRTFTEFFVERGHRSVPSSSLVPLNDPTVLLTSAGMQQMTPYFLGLETPPANRMTSIQKCFRTVDIDEVGDASHLTFFEMLGNFSVGDYFKPEAIDWAWEFLTQVLGVPAEKWSVTVHETDDFSYDYWRDAIGLPEARIRRLGDEDNWWGPVGETGPNGPDSEIYYDLGPEIGCGRDDCGPACPRCDRYLETWNLVFMEFFKERDGSQRPLPRRNIDTGMGLERISMVMQGKSSVYDTDLYLPLIERAADLAGTRYHEADKIDRSLRVIADHSRAVTFLIADGVLPGNEGRGYVLRRILRRAIRHGRLLGLEQAFLAQLVDVVVEMFSRQYPELVTAQDRIKRVVSHDEERFGRTLSAGIARFETLVTDLRSRNETMIPGADAFRLYDTYGFPLELTVELAEDEELSVDRAGFDAAMEAQREQSRATATSFAGASAERTALYAGLADQPVTFVGYDTTEVDATTVIALIGATDVKTMIEAGEHAEVVLDTTPFYAESGGQVGDTGVIRTATGVFQVEDTRRPAQQLIVHRGIVLEGFLETGQTAAAQVDRTRRDDTRRNHTATHLLHAALHRVVGEHARQAGSLVAPDRLRFDFTSMDAVDDAKIEAIERLVNEQILENLPVETTVMEYAEAMETGAMALFGEKYGDRVRVVSIPGFSKELCGGTHVRRTGDIGLFLITSEASVASGIRRIEATTGHQSLERALSLKATSDQLARSLHVGADQIVSAAIEQTERLRNAEREIERLRVELASSRVSGSAHDVETIDGIKTIITRVEAPNRDALLKIGDRLRDQVGSGVVVLGSLLDGQPALVVMVTKDLTAHGFDAGKLFRAIAPVFGGKGGGRAVLAQGGGGDAAKFDDALAAARGAIHDLASG